MSQLSFETRFSGENSQVFPSPEALRSPFHCIAMDIPGPRWMPVAPGNRCTAGALTFPMPAAYWIQLVRLERPPTDATYTYINALPIFGFVWMGNLKTSERSGQEVENRTDYGPHGFIHFGPRTLALTASQVSNSALNRGMQDQELLLIAWVDAFRRPRLVCQSLRSSLRFRVKSNVSPRSKLCEGAATI